ncbi:MAG: sulfotransferase [Chitinophagales bacterium]|nr:sulfotransferase [Chitinophagales bacterium]
MWQFKVLKLLTPFGRKMGNMCHKLIWQRSHKGTMADKAKAVAYYNAHIEAVKTAVPAERLLIFSADQGWEPLCKFLGKPVSKTNFPNVNDRNEIKKEIADMTKGAYFILGIATIAVLGLFYGLARLLS